MNILFLLSLLLFPIFYLLIWRKRRQLKRLPPGSLGVPVIGQSLGFLWAMRANTPEKWISDRAKKYGPISKMSLFGKPTVLVHGQAANKLVFTSDGSTMSHRQTESMMRILGDRCLLELMGQDHTRDEVAPSNALARETESYGMLFCYSFKVFCESSLFSQIINLLSGDRDTQVLPLMKTLTFNIICSLLFGLERGRRDSFIQHFQHVMRGVWSIPVNLPFTSFNRGLKASAAVQKMLKQLMSEKRIQLENGASSHQDLITCLLSIRGEDDQEMMSEDEIIQNAMLIMIGGYDTTSILLTFIIRTLANHPNIHAAVLTEQEEIKKSKASGEPLTWEDLAKMKYTWRVAMETLRTIPPVFGGFRTTLADIEHGGYIIPKGWQIFWVASMTHLDDNIFSEPSKFDPARFENPASIPPFCYVPFGGGPRICPGYEFAKVETLVTIHYLVTHFTWQLCCNDDGYHRDPMPEPNQGLPIQIVPKDVL